MTLNLIVRLTESAVTGRIQCVRRAVWRSQDGRNRIRIRASYKTSNGHNYYRNGRGSMATVEIAVGATWVVFGAIMVWSGLFDRSLLPAPVARALGVPFAMIGVGAWIMRFSLRATFGGSHKAKAPR